MCLMQIIQNLDELEQVTNKKVDLSILKNITNNSPIENNVPIVNESDKNNNSFSVGDDVREYHLDKQLVLKDLNLNFSSSARC